MAVSYWQRVVCHFFPNVSSLSPPLSATNAAIPLTLVLPFSFFQLGGPPVPVTINLSIRSMGPVDESEEAFSLDCYFRQFWVDERLKFNATGVSELALNWAFLAKIWVPDTFVVNGKHSYLHKITVPNRFVRINPDGRISYSQRLTIWASCKMDLQKFPLDTQICPLRFGSFGYDAREMVYQWAEPKSVSIDKLGLAQFHLKDFKSYSQFMDTKRRTRTSNRNDSIAILEFTFERQTGFFLLQIYTPLALIVFCSWVAFWLIKTEKGGEVPARTALGATAVLSIVNIGFGGKSRPHVGYATAMDIFIILCFVSVFAALVEFAFINFIDTFVKRRKKRDEEMEAKVRERIEKREALAVPKLVLGVVPIADATATVDTATVEAPDGFEDEDEDDEKPEYQNCLDKYLDQCGKYIYDRTEAFVERRWGPITEMEIYLNTTEVIWKIDSYARRFFPLVFFVLQFLYWTSYLYIL